MKNLNKIVASTLITILFFGNVNAQTKMAGPKTTSNAKSSMKATETKTAIESKPNYKA